MLRFVSYLLLAVTLLNEYSDGYSAIEDARIIAEYKRQRALERRYHVSLDHAKITRQLVHQTNWASVGTISTHSKISGYPMVNVVAIDDNNAAGESTGIIHFLLTDLDFTGQDWRALNKVTFLFTDEQNENCSKSNRDPMEPTCARAYISGKVVEMDKNDEKYNEFLAIFAKRHPASSKWIKSHNFYMCELQIENIYIIDFYGGPHDVPLEQYLNAKPDNEV